MVECLLNGWVFVYELSGCGFELSCSDLNFRFWVCFEQGVPWNSGNYRVWIHSETCMWHDKNIQSHKCTFIFHILVLFACLGGLSRTVPSKSPPWRNAVLILIELIGNFFDDVSMIILLFLKPTIPQSSFQTRFVVNTLWSYNPSKWDAFLSWVFYVLINFSGYTLV